MSLRGLVSELVLRLCQKAWGKETGHSLQGRLQDRGGVGGTAALPSPSNSQRYVPAQFCSFCRLPDGYRLMCLILNPHTAITDAAQHPFLPPNLLSFCLVMTQSILICTQPPSHLPLPLSLTCQWSPLPPLPPSFLLLNLSRDSFWL